jgi:RimJ/RimL family protein N-acetyltransferase
VPVLENAHVRLERLDADKHGASLWEALAGQDQLWTYLPYGPFSAQDDVHAWLTARAPLFDPFTYALIVRDRGTQCERVLGLLSLMEIRPADGVAEIGHVLFVSSLQGTFAATAACALVLVQAFDVMGFRRVEWKCDARNEASQRAARRLGFVPEGLFRQHRIVKGHNRDTAWFAMLDHEWPARRAAFADFLAADNSDAAGQQIRPLRRSDPPQDQS